MDKGQLVEKLVTWIKEKTLAAGCQGVVFGLSGGLDSSVLAALCQRAFPQNALGVIMPCHSSQEDSEHALAVARQFSIPTQTVVLDGVLGALLKVLPEEKAAPEIRRLAQANIKARLRMVTLYYFANLLNYLVVGSSDRSELAVGYFTKYGDGAADILPLGNLTKDEVRELARFLGVPQPIINKPPSPGLWEGQSAEEELGLSYEEIDRYLLSGRAAKQIKERIEFRAAASSHKRSLPPIAQF